MRFEIRSEDENEAAGSREKARRTMCDVRFLLVRRNRFIQDLILKLVARKL